MFLPWNNISIKKGIKKENEKKETAMDNCLVVVDCGLLAYICENISAEYINKFYKL